MTNNKQSSVEWLIEQVCNLDWKNLQVEKKLEILEQAKAMHNKEIINSYCDGRLSIVNKEVISAEQYYNETFLTP